MFFPEDGVSARKLRLVMKFILNEIDSPNTEVFPKQDSIANDGSYGNFINAPMFGKCAPKDKTVFVYLDFKLILYRDQWSLLSSIKRNLETVLDKIIEENDLDAGSEETTIKTTKNDYSQNNYGLPICIRKMLNEGVTFDQRIACFRLAVNLRRIGLPQDVTLGALMNWRLKNKPNDNNRIITPDEIIEQIKWAYSKAYKGYGCEEPIVKSFCDSNCILLKYANRKN